MTAAIEVAALRSDDPLGFLASLGLVEVTTTAIGECIRLGWDELGGPATIEAPVADIGELVSVIHDAVRGWYADGRVVPAADNRLIRRRLSSDERQALIQTLGSKPPNDPMRMPPEVAVAHFAEQRGVELGGEATGARWLTGLVAQLGVIEKGTGGGYCDLTPLYAPAGQQTLFQLFEKYTRLVCDDPCWIEQALVGWKRTPLDSGANLDRRDLRDAAATASGLSENAGVPGATWLALQSVPFFRLVGDGQHGMAVGWLSRRGGRPRTLAWPVWRPRLDRPAIEVMLAHPATRPGSTEDLNSTALQALGVLGLLRSSRRAAGNSDGPLQGSQIVWP